MDKGYDDGHDGVNLEGPWEEGGCHQNGVVLTQCQHWGYLVRVYACRWGWRKEEEAASCRGEGQKAGNGPADGC